MLRPRPTAGELRRSRDQRRADALVQMAIRSAATPADARKPRPLFTVGVGADRFRQLSELHDGTIPPPGLLARFAQEGDLEAVLFDRNSRAVKASTARTFTGVLRRIVQIQHPECDDQTCDEPAYYCQIDHRIPDSYGRPTSQDNARS